MPFRYYSPGATLFSFAVAGIMSIFGKRKRRCSSAYSVEKKSRPKPLAIPQHPGLTSEVFSVSVLDPVHSKRTHALPVGAMVELKLIDIGVYVVAGGQQHRILVPIGDPLRTVLAENRQYHAYIKEREEGASDFYDFFNVIVYF